MKTIKFLLITILLVFPLGQLTHLPLDIPGINIYFHDLLILCLFLFVLTLKKKKEILLNAPLQKVIFAFFLIGLISLLVSLPSWGIQKTLIGSLYLVRWGLYSLIYFLSLWLIKEDKKFKNVLIRLLIFAGFLSAVLGLSQYFFYPDFYPLSYFGWDPHLYRVSGTYYDAGFSGMIYLLTLILLFVFSKKKINIPILVSYLALSLTYARSVYLAFLAGLLVVAKRKYSLRFFTFWIIIFCLTLVVLPRPKSIGVRLERKDTVYSRLKNWKKGIAIFKKTPLFGVGFNNYRWAQNEALSSHAGAGNDSSLLFVLATTGIVGFVIYFYFLASLLKIPNLALFVTTVTLIIHSFFNNSLFYSWIMIWWWFVAAAAREN